MPLRTPLTTIHFHTRSTLFPKVDFKDLQFPSVQFCHQQYRASAIFFYVNMVQTEGFQTKQLIPNNGQWLLDYITNYFTNFCSQVPKHVSRKKNIYYCFRLIGFIIQTFGEASRSATKYTKDSTSAQQYSFITIKVSIQVRGP